MDPRTGESPDLPDGAIGGHDEASMTQTPFPPEVAALIRQHWPVLPCHHPTPTGCSCGDLACPSPGKHPRSSSGLHSATTDPVTIQRWWQRWPASNVAVRTGAAPAGAGIVVLDIDPAHGGDASLADLIAEHAALPDTLGVATGGDGRHLYYRHPASGPIPNSAGRLGPGLDVRGDGGYVIVPPSRHISGGSYRWMSATPIQPLPGWLVDLLTPPVQTPPVTPIRGNASAWARAALHREAAAVRSTVEGGRNDRLNRAAFSLGQLVGAHLDIDVVITVLTDAALESGLGQREAQATIASGLRAGATRPRRHPAPPH